MSLRRYYSMPFFGGLAAVLSGCTGSSTAPANIDYRQIGLCDTYTTSGGAQMSKANEVYVIYKIVAVDNTKRSADFTFLPTRLYVNLATTKQQAEWHTNQTSWNPVGRPVGTPDWFGQRNNRRFVSKGTGFTQAMSVRAAAPIVISQAANMTINAYTIVSVAKPDEDLPIEQISINLYYDLQEGDGDSIAADPPVVLNNTNAAQTSWPHPHNCQELPMDRLAS
jgi:hypothetical protein